ncbi:hypothetical protein RP20_CCG026370 [Aedes albopictus]|nr:hypothetical protein RP20_CCG026370 [Aedes albopictus]
MIKWTTAVVLGAALRYLLMHSHYGVTIQNRVEVATPLNSWKRAIEGAYLYANGTNPYDGDLYHQNPFVLVSVWFLLEKLSAFVSVIFIQLEVGTILMLKSAAGIFIRKLYDNQRSQLASFAKGTKELQISPDDVRAVPYYVALAYMFNPYSILNCVGQTTTVLSNFLLALFLLGIWRTCSIRTRS